MKSVRAALALHLAQETTSLCRLLKITRADGTVFRFTDFDNDLTYDDGDGVLVTEGRWEAQPTASSPWWNITDDTFTTNNFSVSGISTFTYFPASAPWAASQMFNGYGGAEAFFQGTPAYNLGVTFNTVVSCHYDAIGAGCGMKTGLATGTVWASTDSYIGFLVQKNFDATWGNWQLVMGGPFHPATVIDSGVQIQDTPGAGAAGGVRTALSFTVNDDGTLVTWYINGTSVGTATANIPTAPMALTNVFTSLTYEGSFFYRVESLSVEVPASGGTYLCGETSGDGNAGDSGPGGGLTFTAVEIKADGSPNNSQVTGFLSDSGISEHDVRAHLYDNATFELRAVNWSDLTMGDLKLLSGTIGDIEMKNGQYQMELRGWTQKLTTTCGSLYGPNCRAELFGGGIEGIDPTNHWKCRLNRADWVQNGTVGSSPDLMTIVPTVAGSPAVTTLLMVGSSTPTDLAPAGWFDHGVITFTSGALDGYSFEIAVWDGLVLSLYAATPMPFAPAPGDTFEIEPGCDKTPNTCHTKFVNIINFAGEANIPGLNVIGAVSRPQVPD
jgi:hypothetical protein